MLGVKNRERILEFPKQRSSFRYLLGRRFCFKCSLCVTQVKGFLRRAASPSSPPPEGDVRAFLTEEDRLHTCDDLTKVNPVTAATGKADAPDSADAGAVHALMLHNNPPPSCSAVLKCLQARYRLNVFYTHAGCTLVALNPFRPVPHLYSQRAMKEYHCAPRLQVQSRRGLACLSCYFGNTNLRDRWSAFPSRAFRAPVRLSTGGPATYLHGGRGSLQECSWSPATSQPVPGGQR